MFEDDIPKQLRVGETYDGEQLSGYIQKFPNTVLYTNNRFPLQKNYKYRIEAIREAYPHSNESGYIHTGEKKVVYQATSV